MIYTVYISVESSIQGQHALQVTQVLQTLSYIFCFISWERSTFFSIYVVMLEEFSSLRLSSPAQRSSSAVPGGGFLSGFPSQFSLHPVWQAPSAHTLLHIKETPFSKELLSTFVAKHAVCFSL